MLGYGDSSSCADGTGSEPHANNWLEPGGNNREFFLNATWWLLSDAATPVEGGDQPSSPLDLHTWPNPFNPFTTISCTMRETGLLEVDIFDLAGRRVRSLTAGSCTAGEHHVQWDGLDSGSRPVPSGVYLVRARAGSYSVYVKVVLAK